MPWHPNAVLERHTEDKPRAPEGQKPAKCPCRTKRPREMCPQLVVSKALSRSIMRKSACLLADITLRKSQCRGRLSITPEMDASSTGESGLTDDVWNVKLACWKDTLHFTARLSTPKRKHGGMARGQLPTQHALNERDCPLLFHPFVRVYKSGNAMGRMQSLPDWCKIVAGAKLG